MKMSPPLSSSSLEPFSMLQAAAKRLYNWKVGEKLKLPDAPKVADEFLIELARAYFGEKRGVINPAASLQEVAGAVGISGSTQVRRLLLAAEAKGLLTLEISKPQEHPKDRLVSKYDLQEAIVCGSATKPGELRANLGQAAGKLLDGLLSKSTHKNVALGGGRTLHAMVRSLEEDKRAMTVSPLSLFSRGQGGNSLAGPMMDAPFLAMALAWKSRCHTSICAIPPLSGNAKEAALYASKQFALSSVLREVFKDACNSNIIFTGASHLERESHLTQLYKMVGIKFEALEERGCVGHINFCPVDEDGNDLSSSLVPKSVGPMPDHCHPFLPTVGLNFLVEKASEAKTRVILVAGGPGKTPLIKALLAVRAVNVLITDRVTANALLDPSETSGSADAEKSNVR